MAEKRVIARFLRWLLPLSISGLAIWLILREIDFPVFMTHLAKIRWQTLALATAIYFISYALRAFCWYILLRRKVSYRDAFFTMGVGYLLNNIFPFRLGEIGRAVMLDDSGRTSPLEVFSSVVVERIFDVFLAALFILSVLPRILSSGYNQTMVLVALSLAVIGLVVLFLLARFREQVATWLTRWGERSGFIRDWLQPKVAHALEGFAVLTDARAFLLAFGSLALSWLLAFGKNYLIFNNLSAQPPFWWMTFVLSAGAFGAALPSAPAGLGVYEGVVVGAFALLGVGTELAFTHAIVTHAMVFVYANLIGLVGLRLRGEALVAFLRRVIRRSPKIQTAE
ncbi:MAG: lysylphosphatidylglycerol synthase transmembrane domain-containing protein [Brevefilum sp.]